MREEKQVRVIEVVPYNSQWKEDYLKEMGKIILIMNDEIIDIHHIGSTSIPGIYAKPVIDILIGVVDIKNIDKYNGEMDTLGYVCQGEYGIKGRRFFMKGLYNRTHHIHIFQSDNPEILRHINFRDYMISHLGEARIYSELKREMAIKFRYDIEGYCNGKDAFIKDIDIKAERWAKTK